MAAKRVSRPKGPAKTERLPDVRALAEILREYDLTEVEVERSGERVRISRGFAPGSLPPGVSGGAAAMVTGASAAEESVEEAGVSITSPFVGTFYRAPSPGSPAFAEVGQVVTKGQVLCIVEAMKLMNEIEAEASCKILAILVNNGDPVEYGQALFRVQPA
ncbi:MAG: acetyl-CoA carboxylase biotin carboxyl carrier protein [Deltaproteobacteria bacterium]|nr:acetyl-CoA carboxylase biotin carboxyl carrier protein [Deltaproteobacteria bacterium]